MKEKAFISAFLLTICLAAYGQTLQTIKGIVTDRASLMPISYATVYIPDLSKGTSTDSLGRFRIDDIAIGRYDLHVSFMGYDTYVVKEVMVGAAKEVFLEIPLKENVWELSTVVVTPEVNKSQPLNKMAAASARMFSVEEANRYAGGLDDPARLASSFAGVAGSIASSGITIRGNSPQFMQWKLEGVEIPNPTHFPDMTGVGGGIITALSSQVMGNSDFLTGAFPAEYGNALSGVFDVKLRNGNNETHENTFQLGTLGIDFASEGPFKKGKQSSYLFNYRFATMGLIDMIVPGGMGQGAGLRYQDLSFKLHFPTLKAGTFSVWGIGTLDRYKDDASDNPGDWETEDDKISNKATQYMAATGITHKYFLKRDTYMQSNLAVTIRSNDMLSKRTDNSSTKLTDFDMEGQNIDAIFGSFINKKISANHTNRTGVNIKGLFYNLDYKMRHPHTTPLVTFAKGNGGTALFEAYTNSTFELSPKLTANVGINGRIMLLNNQWMIEPRANLRWKLNNNQSLALAYGLHSRHEKLDYYFVRSQETGELVNKKLDFSKAHHIVLAYDRQLSTDLFLKIEPYFQYLYDIPVEPGTSFSIVNHKLWYINMPLVNRGKGINYGVDVTLERYMRNGFYYMFTGSLFNSRYKGGDNIWRNTRLNRNYLMNILGGKEWFLGKMKRNVLGVNIRLSFMGGERYSPVHPNATPEMVVDQQVPMDETRAYQFRQSPAFISNITVTYKINRNGVSHEFAAKILNANGYKEFLGYTYDYRKQAFVQVKEAFVIPNISYRIDF